MTNAIEIVERLEANPREEHYIAVKRIFRYLKGTLEFGLWYDKSNDFTLSAYTDADWTSSMDNRKSTSGGAFFLRGRLIPWLSKKQDCTSQSIAELEYVVAKNNCNQVIWMKQILKDIKIEISEPIFIHCDNKSRVNMFKNLVLHLKTKHIPIKYHMLIEKVIEKEIRLEHVSIRENIADIFTKPLPKENFEYF